MTTLYQNFQQRFKQLFKQEIECDDQDSTVETIITLMDKCGLQELLDRVPIENPSAGGKGEKSSKANTCKIPTKKGKEDSPNSTDSSQSGKKINGYHLFIKEVMAAAKSQNNAMSLGEAAKEWRELSKSDKEDYKERAKLANES
jgi:hypothetical protein